MKQVGRSSHKISNARVPKVSAMLPPCCTHTKSIAPQVTAVLVRMSCSMEGDPVDVKWIYRLDPLAAFHIP